MVEQEQRLIELAAAGDLDAFGVLYERYSPGVYNLVFRMVGNRDDAEDIRQEVFMRVHRSLGGFKGRARFSTWLYRIATNVCLDQLRRRKPVDTSSEILDETNWEALTDHEEGNPVAAYERQETQDLVQKALLEVPEHYRVLLILRHLEDRPYEEIAQIVGCSVNALNVRLHRARQAFRKVLQAHMEPQDEERELSERSKANIPLY